MTNITTIQIEMHKASQYAKATSAFLDEIAKGKKLITCPKGVSVPYFEQAIRNHGYNFHRWWNNKFLVF